MLDIMITRRNFLRAAGLLGVSAYMSSPIQAAQADSNKALIWVWLGGGASHLETFDPKPNAPEGIKSVRGFVSNNGIDLGGDFVNLIKHTDKFSIVRSFKHSDANHSSATHYVMTGHPTQPMEAAPSVMPGYGSVIASKFGPFGRANMPTYVRGTRIEHDDSIFLGATYSPYDANKENLPNITPRTDGDRFKVRYNELLKSLDKQAYLSNKYGDIQDQAYQLLLSNIAEAFKIENESQAVRDRYGKGYGEQILLAKRLVKHGTRFVTMHLPGWDMHTGISDGFKNLAIPLDIALANLLQDLSDEGLLKDTMVVVTGEFGRTYKINATAGRDHWPQLSPLLIAGGEYEHGRIIGESTPNADAPKSTPFVPQDLTATIFDHFGIDPRYQRVDNAGRPRYFIEGDHRNILA